MIRNATERRKKKGTGKRRRQQHYVGLIRKVAIAAVAREGAFASVSSLSLSCGFSSLCPFNTLQLLLPPVKDCPFTPTTWME